MGRAYSMVAREENCMQKYGNETSGSLTMLGICRVPEQLLASQGFISMELFN
jgi:hypothetical protein